MTVVGVEANGRCHVTDRRDEGRVDTRTQTDSVHGVVEDRVSDRRGVTHVTLAHDDDAAQFRKQADGVAGCLVCVGAAGRDNGVRAGSTARHLATPASAGVGRKGAGDDAAGLAGCQYRVNIDGGADNVAFEHITAELNRVARIHWVGTPVASTATGNRKGQCHASECQERVLGDASGSTHFLSSRSDRKTLVWLHPRLYHEWQPLDS